VCDELDEAKVLSWTGERFRGNYSIPVFATNDWYL
jgi:hypothetical protein